MELVERFVGENPCIIFGSVYSIDVPIIEEILKKSTIDTRIIIAPHLVSKSEVDYFCSKFPEAIQFANLDTYAQQRILIIDHIGSLNKLYQYATQVYVGGGFGIGIHNILEPAVYSIPVYFGPKYHKFPEAEMLIKEQLAFSGASPLVIAKMIIHEEAVVDSSSGFVEKSKKWFKAHSGATQLIFRHLNF
jgi:3-deoxy-D-manno-octulosonic-acid transferase